MIAPTTNLDNRIGDALSLPDRDLTVDSAPAAQMLDPSDLLHSFRRNGGLAMIISFPIAVVTALAVFFVQPETYSASALLQISSQETSLVFDGADSSDFEIFQGTQKELVRTRLVMTAALRNMADSSVLQMEHPVEWMLDNVTVTTPKNTEIMTISTVATKDADPIAVVNATVDAYLVEVVNRERDTRQRRLAGIESVLRDKQAESRRKRNDLKTLAEQLGTGDSETLSIKQQLLAQQIGYIRRQRIELQTSRWSLESKLRALKATNPVDGSEVSEEEATPTIQEIDAALASDNIYRELMRDKITTFRLQSEADNSFKSDSKSPYEKVQSQIESEMVERRDQIEEELLAFAHLRHKAVAGIRQREVESAIANYDSELQVIDELSRQLADDESELMKEFKTVGNQSIDVEMKRREIQQLDVILGSIAQEREEIKVELQSRPRVEVLRKAAETEPANFSTRVGLSGLSGVLAFGFPAALLLLVDMTSSKVNSSSSLSSRTGLTILGSLPTIPSGVIRKLNDPNDRRSRDWRLRLDESVKRTASRLASPFDPSEELQSQVIMVTSAVRGEGKTTLANQLASCLAHSSRRVILCDFDLRRPKLHQLHQLDESNGICDVLRGSASIAESLHSTETEGLKILTAGDCCPKAIRALVEEKVEPLFKELRDIADLIIVDTGAVLSSADIAYLCPHVDQIVFAARRDFSRTQDLVKALRILPASPSQVAGAVVTEKCVDQFDATASN